MGAAPSGSPGCPEFAFSIASIERVRIVFTQSRSIGDSEKGLDAEASEAFGRESRFSLSIIFIAISHPEGCLQAGNELD